jgi:hypothetical protein
LTDDGRVIITTPGSGYAVGDTFIVIGSSATFQIRPADWLLRLLNPPTNGGSPYGEGVDCARAELALAIGLGLVHPSLAEEPAEPPAAA